MTYRSSCNQTTLETAYDGFAHFGKDRRELVSVTVETWKDRKAYTEDIQPKAAEYRLCDGVIAPVLDMQIYPCGCCEYQAPATECVSICTYQAVPFNFTNPPTSYVWTVVGGTIVSGDGTDTIEVQTVSGVDVAVDITVVANDISSGDTAGATGVVQHCHEDTTPCPIFIGPPFNDAAYNEGTVISGFTTADRFYGYITSYALVGNWPAGLSIDQATGVISGTITGIGGYPDLQVSATGIGTCPIAYSNVFFIDVLDATANTVAITQEVAGACNWAAGTGSCTAQGEYLATPSGYSSAPDTWVWSVLTGNATITGGQGTDTILVDTTSGQDVVFTLQVVASNSTETGNGTGQFTHTHTDDVDETLLVSEVAGGSCEYSLPQTNCTTQGTYTASPGGFNIAPNQWVWEVIGAVILESGQGTSTVVAQSTAPSDTTFSLKCTATNTTTGETANDTQTFTLVHTEVSAQLLSLPLLQNRYESGGGTNHALLSRNSTAPVEDEDGVWWYAYIDEFRFPNTQRQDINNGVDYGAGYLGVRYTDNGTSDGLRIEEEAENLFPDSVYMDTNDTFNPGYKTLNDPWIELTDDTTTGQSLWTYTCSYTTDAGTYVLRYHIRKNPTATSAITVRPVSNAGAGTIVIRPDTGAWYEYGSGPQTVTRTTFPDYWEFVHSFEFQGGGSMLVEVKPAYTTLGSITGSNVVMGTNSFKNFQVNSGSVPDNYVPTSGQALQRLDDDVHCLWPAGVVNDFSISCEWIPDYDTASTLLESGNFRIFYTGTALNVTNGGGTAVFTMTVVPETLYLVQAEVSSTAGITIKVNTVSGTPNANTTNIIPDTDLQIGARANLTEFINGTIKNVYMETI